MYETYLLSRHTTLRISRVSNAILISAYLVEGAILQRLFEWLTERLNFRRQWKKRQVQGRVSPETKRRETPDLIL